MSGYGIGAVSRYHLERSCVFHVNGLHLSVLFCFSFSLWRDASAF
jgi:hypothetical protein